MRMLLAMLAVGALLLSIIASVVSIQRLHKFPVSAVTTFAADEVFDAVANLSTAVTDLKSRLDGIDALITLLKQAPLSVDSELLDDGHSRGAGNDVGGSPLAKRGSVGVSAPAGFNRFSPPGGIEPPPSEMLIVDPTPEQQARYEAFSERLDDPVYLRSLSMKNLLENAEFNAMPAPLQRLLLDKAVEKFNRGELDKDTFIGTLQKDG